MIPRRCRSWLLALAGTGWLAAQEPAKTPAPDERGTEAAVFAGWLHEVLDGDVARAQAAYSLAANAEPHGGEARALAVIRLIDLARLSGDPDMLERAMQALGPRRAALEPRMRERVPPTAGPMRAAVAAKDNERVKALRRQFLALADADQSLLTRWLPSTAPRALAQDLPAPAPSLSPRDELRLHVPLPGAFLLRCPISDRAAGIVWLEAARRGSEAQLLEADAVARIRLLGRWHWLARTTDPRGAAESDHGLACLEQVLGRSLLTTREHAALAALLPGLRQLDPESAQEQLRRLPWFVAEWR